MKETADFLGELNAGIRKFEENNNMVSYNEFLELLFNGIKDNVRLKVPFDVDFEKQDGAPAVVEYNDGSVALVVLTNMSEETAAYAVPITLRSLVKEMDRRENCDGMIINPGYDDLFIPKALIKSAVNAGYQIAIDEIEEEAEIMAENNSDKDLVAKRPLPEDQFAAIEDRIRAFDSNTDDFLKISFPNDEDLLFLQVLRTDRPGKRHLSFGYDMDDFGWDKPLVLGNILSVDKTIEILRKVCVEEVEPDPHVIKELEHFKHIG